MNYVERDCTITSPSGREFTADGAFITTGVATVYLSSRETIPEPTNPYCGRQVFRSRIGADEFTGTLTTWHGEKVGTYRVVSRYFTGPYRTPIYAIVAMIDGTTYHGRTQGPGMVCNLRAHKHQSN